MYFYVKSMTAAKWFLSITFHWFSAYTALVLSYARTAGAQLRLFPIYDNV